MPVLDVDGVGINYIVEGAGSPIVLVHGFASSLQGNWRSPGIVAALVGARRQVVALDCRGHGRSGKPADPDAYSGTRMADDVIALMDHLGIERSDLAGYSMGGFIAASLLVRHPGRFRRVILAGVGDGVLAGGLGRERSDAIARAMESSDSGAKEDETARNFRLFAERTGNDLGALAAMQRSSRKLFDPAKLADVQLPVMVLIGKEDTLVGSGKKLAAGIPESTLVEVPGDHLSAVAAPQFRDAILRFLSE